MKTRDLGEPPTTTAATQEGRIEHRMKGQTFRLEPPAEIAGFLHGVSEGEGGATPHHESVGVLHTCQHVQVEAGYIEEQTDSRTRSITRSEPVYSKGQTISD